MQIGLAPLALGDKLRAVLHASRLSGPSAHGQIAVIFETARPAEVAPLIVQAYGLSKRESEIIQMVARGLSTTEIAESEFTALARLMP